jgi:hypothetical protein
MVETVAALSDQPKVYLFHGMKRSGNHAVIEWLLPQMRCAFVNNAIPLGPILRGKPFPAPVAFSSWLPGQEIANEAETRNGLLVSLEDHGLDVIPFECEGLNLQRVLLVRQPEHLFSSRLRKAWRVDMPAYVRNYEDAVMQRAIGVWKQHAKCYLGEGDSFPGRIAILFDAWVSDPSYRAAISSALGFAFDDAGFGRVADIGGGSSFDGTRYHGRGHDMNVLDRISQLEPREREVLDRIFEEPESRRLRDAMRLADPMRQLIPG